MSTVTHLDSPSVGRECPVCSSRAIRPEPFYYDWRGRRWRLWTCRVCTHGFVDPPLTADDQAAIYSDAYFAAGGDWAEGHFAGRGYADAEAALREEAAAILPHLPPPPRRLLDVGCAGGVFLDAARAAGYDVVGIELNATMAAAARERFGLRVWSGRIEAVPADWLAAPVDLITCLDVLEHIPAPAAALAAVARGLAPDGAIFIRGPMHGDPVARAKEAARRWLWRDKQLPGYPLDVNAFTPQSLERLLAGVGATAVQWVTRLRGFGQVLGRRSHG